MKLCIFETKWLDFSLSLGFLFFAVCAFPFAWGKGLHAHFLFSLILIFIHQLYSTLIAALSNLYRMFSLSSISK